MLEETPFWFMNIRYSVVVYIGYFIAHKYEYVRYSIASFVTTKLGVIEIERGLLQINVHQL